MSTFLRPSNLLIVLLTLIAAGSLSAFLFEKRTADGLTQENESLRAMTNEIDRLRAENSKLAGVPAEDLEVERLRKDLKDLYKLRNEVRELREEKAAWNKSRSANEGELPTADVQTRTSPTTGSSTAPRATAAGPPKPWLGFYYVKLPQTTSMDNASNPARTGVLVSFIEPGSPAEKAGLKVSDNVVAFQSQPVQTVQELIDLSGKVSIGQTVGIEVIREGVTIQLQLSVTEKPQ